jgi:hypothetical protein
MNPFQANLDTISKAMSMSLPEELFAMPDYKQPFLPPQVALMNLYGDYPVDLSNGLVDISIPLHTITIHRFDIPLQLKFHASGLKADERQGILGLRWVLSGNGHVSRIIKGYADEYKPFNQQVKNPGYTPDFYTLYGTTCPHNLSDPFNMAYISGFYWPNGSYFAPGSYQDTEYDLFSYSLPSGRSGKFILKDSAGIKTACLMPYEPLKIQVVYSSASFLSVKIVDEDGISYCFGRDESRPNNQGGYVGYLDGNEDNWPVVWYLSSIVSANKQDSIFFDYLRPNLTSFTVDKSVVISDDLFDNSEFTINGYNCRPLYPSLPTALYRILGNTLTDSYSYFRENDYIHSTSPYLHTIQSIQVKSSGRPCETVSFSYLSVNGQTTYLNEMTVKDAQQNTVKKIKFIMKNNLSGNLKLLDKIEFTDVANTNRKEIFTMDYYDSANLPGYGDLSKNSDWWGYYSATGGWLHTVNNLLVKKPDVYGNSAYIYKDIENASTGNKASNEADMKLGMIKSILYPTGGKTEFEYESNFYQSLQSGINVPCGGLRIKTIKNIPESGKTEIKRYEYGNAVIPFYLLSPNNRFHNLYLENEHECYVFCYMMNVIVEQGSGKYVQRILHNTFPSRYNDFHSNIVYYPQVTELLESNSTNIGKTVYDYNIRTLEYAYYQSDQYGTDFTGHTDNTDSYKHLYINPTDFWQGNHLSSKTVYNTGGQKIKQVVYEYAPFTKESVYDLPVFRYKYHTVSYLEVDCQGQEFFLSDRESDKYKKEIDLILSDIEHTFGYRHQEYTIGAEKLIRETEYTYSGANDKLVMEKEILYEPQYLLPEEEKVTDSEGKTHVIAYKYPFNCADKNIAPYVSMTYNHQLTPRIETRLSAGNPVPLLLETAVTDYQQWYPYGYYPINVRCYQTNHAPETRIQYLGYDLHGNPQYVKKDGINDVVWLWSYSGRYPVAEIRNATYAEVVEAIVGGQSAIGNIAASSTLSNSDSIKINSLRDQLPAAQVSTYTYKPLAGIQTATDPRKVTVYYDYDSFGRLKETYYKEGNTKKIIESYDYHYKN